jgi:hypothetical protein
MSAHIEYRCLACDARVGYGGALCESCAPPATGVLVSLPKAPRVVLNVEGRDVRTTVPVTGQPRHTITTQEPT